MALIGVYTITLYKTGEPLGLVFEENAVIRSLNMTTPAARVFHIGDRILSINDKPVFTREEVKQRYSGLPVGIVTFVVDRSGEAATTENHTENDRYITILASGKRPPGRMLGLGVAERDCAGFKAVEITRVDTDSVFRNCCRPGDLIVAVNGNAICDRMTLLNTLRECGPDIMLEMARKESRDGAIQPQPSASNSQSQSPASFEQQNPDYGTFEVVLHKEPGKHLGLGIGTMENKAVVLSIRTGSIAEGRLKRRDCITEINGRYVCSADDARKVISTSLNETVFRLKIERSKQPPPAQNEMDNEKFAVASFNQPQKRISNSNEEFYAIQVQQSQPVQARPQQKAAVDSRVVATIAPTSKDKASELKGHQQRHQQQQFQQEDELQLSFSAMPPQWNQQQNRAPFYGYQQQQQQQQFQGVADEIVLDHMLSLQKQQHQRVVQGGNQQWNNTPQSSSVPLRSILTRPRERKPVKKSVSVAEIAPEVVEISFDEDIDPNKKLRKVPRRS